MPVVRYEKGFVIQQRVRPRDCGWRSKGSEQSTLTPLKADHQLARKIVHSIKCLLCKHDNLSMISENPHFKNSGVVTPNWWQSQHVQGRGGRWTLGACGPASLGYVVNLRTLRYSVSKSKWRVPKEEHLKISFGTHTLTHAGTHMLSCTHTHAQRHSLTYTYTHICTPTHLPSHKHLCIHTRTHAYTLSPLASLFKGPRQEKPLREESKWVKTGIQEENEKV